MRSCQLVSPIKFDRTWGDRSHDMQWWVLRLLDTILNRVSFLTQLSVKGPYGTMGTGKELCDNGIRSEFAATAKLQTGPLQHIIDIVG
jgi:hypothetical protein